MRDVQARPVGGAGLEPHPVRGRFQLIARDLRFALRSVGRRDWDFVRNGLVAAVNVVGLSVLDTFHSEGGATCNLCGWIGRRFYPNTGPGYDERDSICPGCLTSDRYRTLYGVLERRTTAFSPGSRVIEVAPLRSLERIFLNQPGVDYTSFDIERHAMEAGDITRMRFDDDSVDWFVCFHVLEHIPDEVAALREIHRVLRDGGTAVLQVPMDWDSEHTREYAAPDPRDVNHVRRHGLDFPDRIAEFGFVVERVDPVDLYTPAEQKLAGLSLEPIFLARATKVEEHPQP